MKSLVFTALVVCAFGGGAAAQSLDELPGEVAKISRSIVAQCTKGGGKARYEPLELVTSVFFGADFDGGGRESFVIDGSKLNCKGGKAGRRPACNGSECRLVVIDPTGASGYRVDFDAPVRAWALAGAHAADKGPDAILELTVGGETHHYTVDGQGLKKLE
jgi:hypothetical protein